ncbi:hypothetical protein PHMEG_00036018 [Phytophthora megakarya]|uniref:PiggyBac transposable element-derived protein domain-containing protein n=1 Tax=Phytophthora megakarya TaxID=4795 RepID=A0A225UMZ1_9STRA|nr:hypothetical protein PHMEG_00036018 [Phytophthora megakarya]
MLVISILYNTGYILTVLLSILYRAEIYQGRLNSDNVDLNQGPNAVLRNVEFVLEGLPRRRLIITDRFYSSVLLSSILLQRGLYHVGTIQTRRRGYCKSIPYKQAKRPKTMDRGVYRIAQSKVDPKIVAVSWMDNRPVHFIATGCSTRPTTLARRTGATGVMKMKKYYHTIFLGLVDMALINAYIIYRRVQSTAAPGRAPATHAEFQRLMQRALLDVGPANFSGDLSVEALVDTPVSKSSGPRYTLPANHMTKQVEVYRTTRGKNGKESKKRRQYGCKVCSLLRPSKTPWETTYYCVECSEAKMKGAGDSNIGGKGKIYLCQKVRQHDPSGATNSATCSQIWHDLWRGGTNIPPTPRSQDDSSACTDGCCYSASACCCEC